MTYVSVLRSRVRSFGAATVLAAALAASCMSGGSEPAVEIGSLTSGATSAVLSLASDWTSSVCPRLAGQFKSAGGRLAR